MAEVVIDGVLYVPVSEASPHAYSLMDALVGSWAGDGWQKLYPDAPDYLRVVVSDIFENSEGDTVTEFVARVLSKVSPDAS